MLETSSAKDLSRTLASQVTSAHGDRGPGRLLRGVLKVQRTSIQQQ